MKYLYLIRHAKSSWNNPHLIDYERPLNKRGKIDCLKMGGRLIVANVTFDLMVSSPAKRARSTARRIAKQTNYSKKEIVYSNDLYLTSLAEYKSVVDDYSRQIDTLALVGHNEVISDCAQFYTGCEINMPTCSIVVIEYKNNKKLQGGSGRLKYFDYPKK